MFKATLQVDTDVLDAIAEGARNAGRLMETAVKRQVNRVKSAILQELRETPGSPRYPIRWKTARQRRAFFASNGFGRGIPTQRTGELGLSWEVRYASDDNGGLIEIENTAPYARFVIGDDQQPFHIDTGWTPAAQTLLKWQDELTNRLIETWHTVLDPFAGVNG